MACFPSSPRPPYTGSGDDSHCSPCGGQRSHISSPQGPRRGSIAVHGAGPISPAHCKENGVCPVSADFSPLPVPQLSSKASKPDPKHIPHLIAGLDRPTPRSKGSTAGSPCDPCRAICRTHLFHPLTDRQVAGASSLTLSAPPPRRATAGGQYILSHHGPPARLYHIALKYPDCLLPLLIPCYTTTLAATL